MNEMPTAENKEQPKYSLNLIVHRHGPKQAIDGPLSDEGKEITREYFANAYHNVTMDRPTEETRLETSPIHRALQTSEIYSEEMQKLNATNPLTRIQQDERLSEGGLAENKEVIEQLKAKYGGGSNWITAWMEMENRPTPNIKTGKEAIADFSEWLLDKISIAKEKTGYQEVDAFSHGPVMAAFLIKLQEKFGEDLLPRNWRDLKIFDHVLSYLSYINIRTDSDSPDLVRLSFTGKTLEFPISFLSECIKEGRS